jgi:hypothetical protein
MSQGISLTAFENRPRKSVNRSSTPLSRFREALGRHGVWWKKQMIKVKENEQLP